MIGLLAQVLISGLAIGAIYALIAAGFTLLWQSSQTINFAQGEFVIVPAFFMLAAMIAWPAVLGWHSGGAARGGLGARGPVQAVDRRSHAAARRAAARHRDHGVVDRV